MTFRLTWATRERDPHGRTGTLTGSVEEIGEVARLTIHEAEKRGATLWFAPLMPETDIRHLAGTPAALRYRDRLPVEVRCRVPTEPWVGQFSSDPTCEGRTWHHFGDWCWRCEGWA